jgi:hypothetical protein
MHTDSITRADHCVGGRVSHTTVLVVTVIYRYLNRLRYSKPVFLHLFGEADIPNNL